jgi:uncharacterized protein (DUF427 family)
MKVLFHDRVIAESQKVIELEGRLYFPPESVDHTCFIPSSTQTFCPRKGEARYLNLQSDDFFVEDIGWYYAAPRHLAERIKDFIAFYPSKVKIVS